MKRITILMALTLVVALCMPAVAEVEEITVGGSIWILGEYKEPGFQGAAGFDDDLPSQAWYTQRTRVNFDATLSGGVRGFVELQSYSIWGDDSASTTTTVVDDITLGPPPSFSTTNITTSNGDDNNVDVYQAYIDMNNIADYPVMLRIGRQELSYGREYLIGNNDAGSDFSGLSFDAIKVVYSEEDFQIDVWTAKLFEGNGPTGTGFQDEDIDFYGAYGTYTAIENTTLDAYLLLIRDPSAGGDVAYLYTIGGRGAGIVDLGAGAIDYNAEIAFQFGDTTAGGDYEAWTLNLMAGYTFTGVQWTPRLEAEYAFFSGDDDALSSDTETFSRGFSDVHYGELNLGGTFDAATTNMHIIRLGGSAVPVEKLTVSADFYLFWLAEDDGDLPISGGTPVFGNLQLGDDEDAVGYELDIVADYQYTEDLNLRVGWAHFFADDAIENSFGDDDDVDYLFVQAALDF